MQTTIIAQNSTGNDTLVEVTPNVLYYAETKGASEIYFTFNVQSIGAGENVTITFLAGFREYNGRYNIPIVDQSSRVVGPFTVIFDAMPPGDGYVIPIPSTPGIERIYIEINSTVFPNHTITIGSRISNF